MDERRGRVRGEEVILRSCPTAAGSQRCPCTQGMWSWSACLKDRVGETQGPVAGWETADVTATDPYLWQQE